MYFPDDKRGYLCYNGANSEREKRDSMERNRNTRAKNSRRRTILSNPLLICLLIVGIPFLLFSLFSSVGKPDPEADPARMAAESSVPPALTDTAVPDSTSAVPTTTETPTTEPPTTEPPPSTTEAPLGRRIYLTFDDGPGKNTDEVLQILDRYGVKCTFFTVGYYVDRYPETASHITEHGHLIACHTYTHEYDQCYASVDAFFDEMEQWKQAVKNACGFVPERVCVRFPGGSRTPNAKSVSDDIKARLKREGYHWFDWNAADNDKYPQGNTKKLPDTEYFWNSYKETIGWYVNDDNAQVVFLTHDSERGTVEILGRMIEDLLDKGYTFCTLDQHPEWNEW